MKTLYDHGQVYTGQLPLASAFVVEGDRFLAVGNREDLEKFVDNDTKKWTSVESLSARGSTILICIC